MTKKIIKNEPNSYPCSVCKEVFSEESGACEGFICEDCLGEMSYKEQLKYYAKMADKYFSFCKICPTGEEIVEYVAQCVENQSGCDVDDATFLGIAKKLGITLD